MHRVQPMEWLKVNERQWNNFWNFCLVFAVGTGRSSINQYRNCWRNSAALTLDAFMLDLQASKRSYDIICSEYVSIRCGITGISLWNYSQISLSMCAFIAMYRPRKKCWVSWKVFEEDELWLKEAVLNWALEKQLLLSDIFMPTCSCSGLHTFKSSWFVLLQADFKTRLRRSPQMSL